MAFQALKYIEELVDAGVPEEQAKIQARHLIEVIDTHLATKHDIALVQRDIEELKSSTKHDIEELKSSTKHDIEELKSSTKHDIALVQRDIKELEFKIESIKSELKVEMRAMGSRLTLQIVGLIGVLIAISSTILNFLK